MFGFWILAALLLLAAYALFLPTIRGRWRVGAISRQKLNLELHRQRREELVDDAAGFDTESLSAELDRDLLSDLASTEPPTEAAGTRGRTVLAVSLAAAPVLAYLLYTQLGRPDLADFSSGPQPRAANAPNEPELQTMIERLSQRLEKEPNDIKGWLLLARSYGEVGQFDKAIAVYDRALALDPTNLDIKGFYAEALAQANGGTFKGRPAEIANEILKVDPHHRNGLWVAAAAAGESGDRDKAIGYLNQLKSQFPPESNDATFVSNVIAKLQGAPTSIEEDAEAVAPPPAKKSIRVNVTIADAFKGKAAPGDTLFVFARAAKGPPMPLAIVKKQVSDLPLEVTLDDSMGMVQGMNLSAFDELIIGARVSKTGKALPTTGDLQGLTAPIEAHDGASYSVVIGEEVR